jgi:hypothetical protein
MKTFDHDLFIAEHRKLKLFLLLLLPLFFAGAIQLLFGEKNFLLEAIGFLSTILLFVDLGIVIGLFTRRYYNWIIIFIFIAIVGLYCKHLRLDGAQYLLTVGFGCLGFTSLFTGILQFKKFRHIPFLKYIGLTSGIVLFLVSLGLEWKILHWPFAGLMFYTGNFVIVPFLFAFVLTLPASGYVNWKEEDRVIFFKAIIIPMIFVFCLCTLMILFPGVWLSIVRTRIYPFNMFPVE